MKKERKIFRFIGFGCFLLITIFFIFKNMVMFSNEILYTYNLSEIETIDCEVNQNLYTSINGNGMLKLNVPAYANNFFMEFANKLNEDVNFILYTQNEYGIFEIENKRTANSGVKNINIDFDEFTNDRELFISFNNSISLSHLSVFHKELNLIQKSYTWLKNVFLLTLGTFIILFFLVYIRSKNKSTVPIKTTRESNIELLRIFCMLLIIAHHCVVHGGILNTNFLVNKIVASLFLPVGKICFITFIAISMWFFIDSDFSPTRFLKTWCQVFFYSVSFTIISFVIEGRFSLNDFLSSLFPIAGNSHGFASSYLLFYLCLPFIVLATKNLRKKQARYLLLILFYAQVLSQIIGFIFQYYQPIYSELTLFIFSYVLMLNLKKWPPSFIQNKKILLLTLVGIYILLLESNYVSLFGKNNKIVDFIISVSGSESSLLIIIAGFTLFFIAKDIRVKKSGVINKVASYTFGILLIHDHNYFRNILWQYFCETPLWYSSKIFIIILIICVIVIFLICSLIDYLRQSFIEQYLIKTQIWKSIIKKWEQLSLNFNKNGECR